VGRPLVGARGLGTRRPRYMHCGAWSAACDCFPKAVNLLPRTRRSGGAEIRRYLLADPSSFTPRDARTADNRTGMMARAEPLHA
jgi:hypothetical protein